MPSLTIVASNRDRLDLNSKSSQWFLKSIQWQDYTDFELLIADGGSKNYSEITEYFNKCGSKIPMKIVQHKIGEAFERALLNNVGVRNANSKYIMCTDVDMILGSTFVSELMKNVGDKNFVESRTMYWKPDITSRIYSGNLDPFKDLDSCKHGRIKKRTTAGGCQCTSIENWEKVRGYDEAYIGWGSEDYDLLSRAKMARLSVRWMGEDLKTIKLFHQHHDKNISLDLSYQRKNKMLLNSIKTYQANPNGWGGIIG